MCYLSDFIQEIFCWVMSRWSEYFCYFFKGEEGTNFFFSIKWITKILIFYFFIFVSYFIATKKLLSKKQSSVIFEL